MATVRIYKVAELLGTTSQEVTALLKRDHGIEVKSASSTIEEVVARQFVDRLAKHVQTLDTMLHASAGELVRRGESVERALEIVDARSAQLDRLLGEDDRAGVAREPEESRT